MIAEISERLGRLAVLNDEQGLRLRRINRIRTIQGSLAIEGNTLTESQITAIVQGKRVLAPPREVQEARNAIAAYEQFELWQPANEKHLLAAHRLLMTALVDDAGQYRAGNVGVMNADVVVHMAPPANRVPVLMRDLLAWLLKTDQHPLIVSSVFHYEFEFIHPFSDGNGRMGRLWQSLILSQWKPVLAHLPVESMIHAQQNAYYKALNTSTQQSDSAPFIEFMLARILTAINALSHGETPQVAPQVAPQVTPQVEKLLVQLKDRAGGLSREELLVQLGLKDRKSFRERYLRPALDIGWVEMTLPDKPNSRLQRYRLTGLGSQVLSSLKG